MLQAKTGDTVIVHYTGKLEDGTVFDSSLEGEPLQFLIGEGDLIPGFEQAVIGMSPGDLKTELIPSDRAYGPHHEEMVLVLDRQQLPPDMPVEVGVQLQLSQGSDELIPVIITEVTEAEVTLDANHPLAGENLTFDIQLVAIA